MNTVTKYTRLGPARLAVGGLRHRKIGYGRGRQAGHRAIYRRTRSTPWKFKSIKNDWNIFVGLPLRAACGIWDAKAAMGFIKDPCAAAINAACCWSKK